eukprot:INCI17153.2.p1 GENE.INCI17153.2~~INCI17153.2.p1  ORF type:complete len:1512 (-),score=230.85 INCI17153.2:2208-6743(-)
MSRRSPRRGQDNFARDDAAINSSRSGDPVHSHQLASRGGSHGRVKASTTASALPAREQPLLHKNLHAFDPDDDLDDDVANQVYSLPHGTHRTLMKASWRDRLVYHCCVQTHIGLALDILQAALAVVSCVVLVACTYTGATIFTSTPLLVFDSIVSTYFLCDYVGRLFLAQRRCRYALTFMAIMDLITVLPIFVEVIASVVVSNTSLDTQILFDVTQAMQAVRILRLVSLARLAPQQQLAKVLFETGVVVLSIVFFSSVLFQLAENYGTSGGVNQSVSFHRALYNITIEVLGRPRIPFSSIYTEFILLGTIIASFGLVLPRIALAGRLWLVSKPQKTFLGRPDVPHIVLIIDDNDDRYGGDKVSNASKSVRESLSKRVLLILVSLLTSQKRHVVRMREREGRNASGSRTSIQLEAQIVVVVRGNCGGAKVKEVQKLVDADARFHRLVTCLEMNQVTELHRADIPNASHVFIMGDGGGDSERAHSDWRSLPHYSLRGGKPGSQSAHSVFNLPHVVDLGAGDSANDIHDMRLATWALQVKEILAQHSQNTAAAATWALRNEPGMMFEEVTPMDDTHVAGPGTSKRCCFCCQRHTRGGLASHPQPLSEGNGRHHPMPLVNTQVLVQFQSLQSKRFATALPQWARGRDHFVFAQRLQVALMAQAVLWPGINQLFETWVLPVEVFGGRFVDKGDQRSGRRQRRQEGQDGRHGEADLPRANAAESTSPDDLDEWGWLDEHARGLSQIIHSGEMPQQAVGQRMDFVAAKMQGGAQHVLLLGVYRPFQRPAGTSPSLLLKKHQKHRGKVLLFNPAHVIMPGDVGIYVSSERGSPINNGAPIDTPVAPQAAALRRPRATIRPSNDPLEDFDKQLRNALAETLLEQVLGKDWASTPAAVSHESLDNDGFSENDESDADNVTEVDESDDDAGCLQQKVDETAAAAAVPLTTNVDTSSSIPDHGLLQPSSGIAQTMSQSMSGAASSGSQDVRKARHVLICGGRLSTTARLLIQQLSTSIHFRFDDHTQNNREAGGIVRTNLRITFLGLWEPQDEEYIRQVFSVAQPVESNDHSSQRPTPTVSSTTRSGAGKNWETVRKMASQSHSDSDGNSLLRSSASRRRSHSFDLGVSRLQFVRGDGTNSSDLLRAGVMTAHSAIVINAASSSVGRQDPLLEDMQAIHTTLAIQKMRPALHVVTELLHQHHSRYLCHAAFPRALMHGRMSTRWASEIGSTIEFDDDSSDGGVTPRVSQPRRRVRPSQEQRMADKQKAALAVEVVASGNVCSTGIVEGLLMRFIDDPIVVPVLRKLLVLSGGSHKQHHLNRRGMPVAKVLRIWANGGHAANGRTGTGRHVDAKATTQGTAGTSPLLRGHFADAYANHGGHSDLEDQGNRDTTGGSRKNNFPRAIRREPSMVRPGDAAFGAAQRLLESNPLLCCIRVPDALAGLRYCQLERLLMWEFGLLALGLRRRAPAWSPVGAGRSMSTGPLDANASDAYLSAAPDPQSILRPHDRVYVLRAPPPKPAQEE